MFKTLSSFYFSMIFITVLLRAFGFLSLAEAEFILLLIISLVMVEDINGSRK
ncbi:hypothetical protein ACMSRV_002988 [Listeria monocytogenes]|uniref:hypothetical protein n=1 Tax=Listeria monocytogenes TaxID=1639 RepID=UPI0005448105|nr:hypothetical protein [Listeria monocytogenes]EHK2470124.1 hypothetical protein [Listeria monocytogenes]EHN4202485.1 hypothetical protein [Listeria monocytogenes]EHN7528634.1 hypothetical protein [Listeria monocytogenes]EHQ6907600.1 hypothetical protein [Listeria monocytogenes]EHS1751789.1 hypothetical protein [Listeria monocytogenes]